MHNEVKNSEQNFIENCKNECNTIKKLSDKVNRDSDKILADIGHIMVILGSISMEIENINTLTHMVTLGCEELDVLCHICHYHEYASNDNSSLEELIATYNLNMSQLDDDMKKLLEILPPETFEEYNCPKIEDYNKRED